MINQQITIFGKRWFDKVNGNTYHSVKVYVNGKLVGFEPYAYGYDEGYLQTAVELLVKAGVYTREVEPDRTDKHGTFIKGNDRTYFKFLDDKRAHPENFVIEVSDVARKKDLA
jgi:hypothetical protein